MRRGVYNSKAAGSDRRHSIGFYCVSIVLLWNAIYIIQPVPASADQPTIRWKIVNRFRYFQKATDFQAVENVYETLKTPQNLRPTVLQLEQALENQGNFNGVRGSATLDGWAASIFKNTCGREIDHRYSQWPMENGDSYLKPTKANLILQAEDLSAATCEWRVDGAVIDTKPCAGPVTAQNVSYEGQHTLEVRPSGAAPISIQVELKDILIVSFGDSFSAGEGNPEKPVRFSDADKIYDNYIGSSNGQEFPVREDLYHPPRLFFDAVWSNPQCHRSMYSQHTRAALQYALEHPHLSVTLLNYSCTGAEVYEGILNAWWGRDDVKPADYDDAPQLVKALRDICLHTEAYENTRWAGGDRNDNDFNSRPARFPKCASFVRNHVDVLLLSIGGNDVGFANMIANAAVNARKMSGRFFRARKWVWGLWRAATRPQSYDQGLVLAEKRIPQRYRALGTMLKDYLRISPGQIIVSAYPQLIYDEKGNLCKADNDGMDVHDILGMWDPETPPRSGNSVTKFNQLIKHAAENQHWRLADQHVVDGAPNSFSKDAAGVGHGLCAAGPTSSPELSMNFPRPDPGETPYNWRPFQPQDWKPYSARNRWFVTPNDAFLTTDYHKRTIELYDVVKPLYAATLSGSFHPNALGQAAVADSVLSKLREALPGSS
jgi:hypothetical protein